MSIPNYSWCEGVTCYMRSDNCFSSQNYFSHKIENISFDLILLKTKHISIAIVYCLYYLFEEELNVFNLVDNDIFILGNTKYKHS